VLNAEVAEAERTAEKEEGRRKKEEGRGKNRE
jgi:hypothetical protein